MKIVNPSSEITDVIDGAKILRNIERAGRTCYKSEDKITDESADAFCRKLIKSGHESVLEHEKITVRFVCDRGVSHEIVRHRLASFSQESTRYVNYAKVGECRVIDIRPFLKNLESVAVWSEHMEACEIAYNKLIALGESPQIARSVLPTALKTEIVVTANIREWRLIFKQRTAIAAHPQMREIMQPLLCNFKKEMEALFFDII